MLPAICGDDSFCFLPDEIDGAGLGMAAVITAVRTVEGGTQIAEGAGILLVTAEAALQHLTDFSQRHPAAVASVGGRLNDGCQHLLQSADGAVVAVVCYQRLLLFTTGPVAFALVDFPQQLSVQLTVVQRGTEVDVARHGSADKTAAAAGVAERLRLVSGADERDEAAVLGVGFAVGRAVLQVGGGDEVLQHYLLALRDAVELVEVDECEGGQPQVQVVLVLEVDAVVVVFLQVTGQQHPAEAGLATALPFY